MNKKHEFLLAADSGGSKTDWICLTQDGTIVKRFTTPGMASLHADMLPIREYIQLCCKELQNFPVKAVYLSLGGPNTDEIFNNLKQTFPDAVVLVEREASGDLVAACMEFLQCLRFAEEVTRDPASQNYAVTRCTFCTRPSG